MLLPWVVPTVLSAIAFWWIYDAQFSIISWSLMELGWIDHRINFLGDPNNARASVIAANVWRGIPFVAISLLAGLQTIPQSLYEAATLDGASRWQLFRFITLPMLTPIIAIVMTFSVLFTFTDFQLIYVLTNGGPVNATHLMATLSFQRGISGGQLGEGAAIAVAMIPFLLASILFSYFGLQRRKWQQGGRRLTWLQPKPTTAVADEGGMGYLKPAAAHRDDLSAACGLRLRAAVPVLLDGDHRREAELADDRLQQLQPVLGGAADAGAHPISPVRDLLSGLAAGTRSSFRRRDVPVAAGLGVCRLCHRARAVLRVAARSAW